MQHQPPQDDLWPPPHIGPHASDTYQELQQRGPPSGPHPFGQPEIGPALTNSDVLVAQAPPNDHLESAEQVYLVRNDNRVQRAYQFVKNLRGDGDPTRSLARHGDLIVCVVLDRDVRDEVEIVFQRPMEGEHTLVVIKAIEKSRPGAEVAARREVIAMQHVLEDQNRHAVSCIEALEDQERIYIVMPKFEGGDIFSNFLDAPEHLIAPGPERENLVRRYFRQMLQCLHFLQSVGICHADLSPENIMLHNDQCRFIDLDTCFQVPRLDEDVNHRLLLLPLRVSGKFPYQAPEIFLYHVDPARIHDWSSKGIHLFFSPSFDGYAIDLWCLGTTLYAMLMGNRLYNLPFLGDGTFRARIYNPWDTGVPSGFDDLPLSDEVRDLLSRMLVPNPEDRLTLSGVMNHTWVVN